jgi:NTE family protein
MTLVDDPNQFEQIARHLRGTSVFRFTSRYDLARLLDAATVKTAVAEEKICEADTSTNAPPSPSFYILHTGDYSLDGSTRLGGPRDGLVGIEDVIKRQPRSITLTAKSRGTYVEVPAGVFYALLSTSTPLRQTLVPLIDPSGIATTYVEPLETGVRGNIVEFVTTIVDAPLSLLIELLAREIATDFTDHVIVLRPCAPGQAPSPAPIQVPGTGLGGLWYAFVDPVANPESWIAYARQFDYVFLDGVPSTTVDTIVKMFFGYADDYVDPPPLGSPRLLQTAVIGQPPLPCSKELYYVNANPTRNTHASDCRIRLDMVKLRGLAQSWNPYMPIVSIDQGLEREMGIWARALTHRRTGIALAGGGVWSMQSVFIIQELSRRKVPLDVITGASAGALVGAYYSVLGLPGLDLMVERGDSGVFDVLEIFSFINGFVTQAFLDHEFGAHACLDNLDVDFRPNSTNLTLGEGVAFVRGPVTSAIRAASSAPPIIAASINGGERFVDGAFSNNLAAQILPYFGADLTFGANTYPPSRRPKSPWVPDFITRLTAGGPINRLTDFTIALNLLANLTGRIENGFADVPYNATSDFALPFVFTSNFRLSSKMVEFASQDIYVLAAIDEFTRRWEHLRRRGMRSWTSSPS